VSKSPRDENAPLAPGTRRSLPSGRSVMLRVDHEGETLEIRAPNGEVEVGIALTPQGPLLRLRGVRLQIDSSDSVDVRCRNLRFRADESLELHAGSGVMVTSERDVRVRTEGQTHIDGDWVNINCEDRTGTGWHDDPALGGKPERPSSEDER